jgi:lipid A 4'-phosphatase
VTRNPTSPSPLRGLIVSVGLLCFGLAATVLLEYWGADLTWTGVWYDSGGPAGGWIHGHQAPWSVLYDYGEIPTILLTIGAAVLFLAARLGKAPAHYQRPCLVVVLTVLLGPGLLVNGILKNYWGRPRPAEIARFGGTWEFQRVGQIGIPGRGKSFPSGHSSMGFAIASASAFYPYHPAIALGALGTGIAYGTLMGVGRMAQGGHFPTDILWSGVLVLFITALLYYVVFRIPEHAAAEASGARAPPDLHPYVTGLLIVVFVVLPLACIMGAWPIYEEFHRVEPVPPGVEKIRFRLDLGRQTKESTCKPQGKEILVDIVARGFGSPSAKIRDRLETRVTGNILHVNGSLDRSGFIAHWSASAALKCSPTEDLSLRPGVDKKFPPPDAKTPRREENMEGTKTQKSTKQSHDNSEEFRLN